MAEILNSSPEQGLVRLFHYDADTDDVAIETVQDVTALVEANRAEYDEYTSLDRYGDMRRVASIPIALYFDLKRQGIAEDPEAMRRWLNDPDNRFFRTSPGTV
jgi:hypothetical protein